MALRIKRFRVLPTLHYFLRSAIPGASVFSTRLPGSGLRFFSKAPDVVSRHLAKYGSHEPALTAWFNRFLDRQGEAQIVVDVGANIGWYTVHAGIHPKVSSVLACEPDAQNVWLLEKNLAANEIRNASVAPWAIGDRRGFASLFLYKSSNLSRHSLLVDSGYGTRQVPIFSLDETLSLFEMAERPIHVIKIDVEGYEFAVLAGAVRALESAKAVILEYSPDLLHQGGRSPDDVLGPMRRAGFVPFLATRSSDLQPIGVEALAADTRQLNVVWLKQGTRPQ
jgi:FkbM family methyltransferase